jgi:ABC-type multidrug transport system fused ATPase/permease subunit
MAALSGQSGIAIAQKPQPAGKPNEIPAPANPAVSPGVPNDARQVRDELNGMFEQFPPSLREVLQLDPTLLSNSNYLMPYPALATYIAQHPEIAHNPGYFIGTRNNGNDYRNTIGNQIADIIEPMAVASVFIVMICILGWIIRSIMNHRRWLRVSKTQNETQNKLLERFTSNEEMLAFIQTSAGQRFLASASMSVEPETRARSAPVGRMLWSFQLGIVMLVTGMGLIAVSHYLDGYVSVVAGFEVAGGLVIALGMGFILSAFGAYILSRRLGLMDPAPPPAIQ